MAAVRPGPASIAGLRWLAAMGPSPLGAWGVAMGWGRRATYSHASRLKASGWVASCEWVRGEGSLIWATRAGIPVCGAQAVAINNDPEPISWAHYDASAWTCAWLTARGRAMIAPREMLLRPEWRGQVEWREHYEPRKRGHRPDLAVRLSNGGVLPVEVELTDKSQHDSKPCSCCTVNGFSQDSAQASSGSVRPSPSLSAYGSPEKTPS